jgi:hypothetical protein
MVFFRYDTRSALPVFILFSFTFIILRQYSASAPPLFSVALSHPTPALLQCSPSILCCPIPPYASAPSALPLYSTLSSTWFSYVVQNGRRIGVPPFSHAAINRHSSCPLPLPCLYRDRRTPAHPSPSLCYPRYEMTKKQGLFLELNGLFRVIATRECPE